jgi:CxxC-x17-CxxC domain-containing protein
MALEEKTLRCRDCKQDFVFTLGEQDFYSSHGLQNEPGRCPVCRVTRRRSGRGGEAGSPRQLHTVTCSECHKETQVPFEPSEGRPVFCRECYSRQKKAV